MPAGLALMTLKLHLYVCPDVPEGGNVLYLSSAASAVCCWDQLHPVLLWNAQLLAVTVLLCC
jgi:hypothetical protein